MPAYVPKNWSRLLYFALFSFVFIFAFTIAWESFLEGWLMNLMGHEHWGDHNRSFFIYILMASLYAGIPVVFLFLLGMWLMRYLNEREMDLIVGEERQRSFAADAAHELRTPLAVLRAQIESMEYTKSTRALLTDVDKIVHIIEQILDKSRFEVLRVEADEVADLSEVCSNVTTYIAPLIIREGRTIELIGADISMLVRGNSFALEQAVKNLISNAAKYSARGTMITVEVSSEPAIHVIDHGRGVPKGQRRAIFGRFHRADRRGAGSGLGLAIVKSVTEAHGGRIEISDTPGGGATFSMRFPGFIK
ncbi:MAG: HAMP domain-containing histidine kinase [Rhodospirillaceae bacterium]|nr:HAMP domain-containing histidine kinase [Rhodospirillaceae bacterium]